MCEQSLIIINLNSFSVESSPKTKRKCGSKTEVENECKDVLFGANMMLACYCNEHDYCNSTNVSKSNFNLTMMMTSMMMLCMGVAVVAAQCPLYGQGEAQFVFGTIVFTTF